MVMEINLNKASSSDYEEIYNMQTVSFKPLLEKYQDYEFSPGAEKIEKTRQRLEESFTDYYFICLGDMHIGAIRICRFDSLCKLKQIFILPDFQGKGYAQQAIMLAESLYPDAKRWELDTICQETKLCHLYEKMGYAKTGKIQHVKDGMDIVDYAK